MDQLTAMRAFVRVVEAGSFTRASDLLDIPKPTLTKHIQALEAHLRIKLLNRTTRRVIVTPDGAGYYERAIRILADIEELDGSITRSQASPSGRLRVDVGGSLANRFIIPALSDFYAKYPDIQIDLGVSDRAIDLVGENVDCVLRGGDLTDPSLIARRLASFDFITCAAPSYIARHGTPTHPSELDSEHQVVGYFMATSGRHMPMEFTKDGETVEVRGRYQLAVNEADAFLVAVRSGLGVAQVPLFMVREDLAQGNLVPVLTDWQAFTMPLHIVYPPNRHLSNKVRVFTDWIVTLFAGNRLNRE
ncbi:LysR family transcriptional regulator [Lacibacterium aquatile]|uniref:LysR family transcriptional regulator n=1 Tax=Lacibacterium aquatile TaxID=1168082 RepID=A0ABW5E154_9PROT